MRCSLRGTPSLCWEPCWRVLQGGCRGSAAGGLGVFLPPLSLAQQWLCFSQKLLEAGLPQP